MDIFGAKKRRQETEFFNTFLTALTSVDASTSVRDLLKAVGLSTDEASGSVLSQPTDFYNQVKEAKKLWRKGGEPVTSTLMDLRVQSASGYGTENLLKVDTEDERYKMLFDYWAANVKRERAKKDPRVEPGMDYLRKEYFTERWRSGLIIMWARMGKMSFPNGHKLTVPLDMGVTNPLTVKVVAKDKEGKVLDYFEYWYYKNGLGEENNSGEDVNMDLKRPDGKGWDQLPLDKYRLFITAVNCQDYEPYPEPYLAQKGVIRLAKLQNALLNSDYSTALKVIWSILMLKKGSDKLLEMGVTYDALKQGLENWRRRLETTIGKKKNAILGETYDTSAEWIVPNLESLLSRDKYGPVSVLIGAALGLIQVEQTITSEGKVQAYINPKPLIQDIETALFEEKRFWENRVFHLIWQENPKKFEKKIGDEYFTLPNLYQKPRSLWIPAEILKILDGMQQDGLLSNKSALEIIPGMEYPVERRQRVKENKSGDDEIFKPRLKFRQEAVKPEGRGKKKGNKSPQDGDEE